MMRHMWMLGVLVGCSAGGGSTSETDGPGEPSTSGEDPCIDGGPDATVPNIITPDVWTLDDKPVVSWVPPDPRGLVIYFHGGADVTEVAQVENTAVLWNLLGNQAHFAIMATQRDLPDPQAPWDPNTPVGQNADAKHIAAVRDELIATTALTEDTPIAFTGFSDGAGMAQGFVQPAIEDLHWPVFASVPHNGAGSRLPMVPTQFHVGENDLEGALAGFDAIVSQLDEAEVVVDPILLPERVITVDDLERDPLWDQARAQECYDDLLAFKLIDEAGVRQVANENIEDALSLWERKSEFSGVNRCSARVRVLWATHRYSGWAGQRECRFLMDALP